mgnify:CR=1 FL=1
MSLWYSESMNNFEHNEILDESREKALREFLTKTGVQLQDLSLLDIALTHASFFPEKETGIGDYESLEFVGDAVLGLVVAAYLYEHLPGKSPGEYTKLRATVVNKNTVARVGRNLDLAPLVRLGKGEEGIGGRKRNALFADSLEAVIGAVFLDAGWETSQAFVLTHFKEELEDVCTTPPAWDYKSMLQNYCQAQRFALPQFEVVRSFGPDHCKHFEVQVCIKGKVCGVGEGKSKKEAEQQAAYQALISDQVIE